jgi:hypothetical protein
LPGEENRCDEYLMAHFVKFKSSTEQLRSLAIATSNIPICGVAYKLNDPGFKFKDSRYFCFLPMPENIEQNGLPFHINGSFGLRDDRSDFKWPTHDNKFDQAAQWNQHMVDEVLNLTLIQMIDYAKEVINVNIKLDNFYSLFPHQNDIGSHWRDNYLKPYFKKLDKTELILNMNDQWIHIKDAFLTNRIEEDINLFINENSLDNTTKTVLSKLIFSLFDSSHLSKIATPQHILDIYNGLDLELVYIDIAGICNKLVDRDLQNTPDLLILADFLIQKVSGMANLNRIKLLRLQNGSWTVFGNNEPTVYLLEPSLDEELKQFFSANPNLQSQIVDFDSLSTKSRYRMIELLAVKASTTQSQIVKYNNSTHFKQFVEIILKDSGADLAVAWKIWYFVCKHFANNLDRFADLKAIPYGNSFLSLDQSNSNGSVRFFVIDQHNPSVSKEVVDLFTNHGGIYDSNHNLNGCLLFDDLHGLEKHAQLANYIPQFSLIDALVHLDKCLSKLNMNLSSFINEHMSSEGKRVLIDDLNTAIGLAKKSGAATTQLTIQFESLVSDRLPIFRIHESGEQTCTAAECDKYMVPLAVVQHNLQIDTTVKVIDLSLNESKANLVEFLKLRDYPLEALLKRSIQFNLLDNKSPTAVKKLTEYVLKNDLSGTVGLFEMAVFKNKADVWSLASDLYDGCDKFVCELVPSSLHLQNEFVQQAIFYTNLKPHLCRKISVEFFEQYLDKYFSRVESDYKSKISLISEFLGSLSQLEQQK